MLPLLFFRFFLLLGVLGGQRNRLRVFVFRDFIFWFASKGRAVERTKHSRLLHPPSFGRCILTARQFMRGAQLPWGSGHSLRSRTVRLPCRRSFACIQFMRARSRVEQHPKATDTTISQSKTEIQGSRLIESHATLQLLLCPHKIANFIDFWYRFLKKSIPQKR